MASSSMWVETTEYMHVTTIRPDDPISYCLVPMTTNMRQWLLPRDEQEYYICLSRRASRENPRDAKEEGDFVTRHLLGDDVATIPTRDAARRELPVSYYLTVDYTAPA